MRSSVRILLVALLLAFAAGSVVNVAGAAPMAVKMALADDGAMDMADCEGCGPGNDDTTVICDMACVAPHFATISADTLSPPPLQAHPADNAGNSAVGHSGIPEPAPPRLPILI